MRNFINNLGALDIGYFGNSFTWYNLRGGAANICERLDRTLVSSECRILFPKVGVVHLNVANSNHIPILMHSSLDHPKTSRPFRFFEASIRDPSCEQEIKGAC